MTKQDKNTSYLAILSIIFVTIVMVGSFVVSFNVLDLLYLIFFYGFLLSYKICNRK